MFSYIGFSYYQCISAFSRKKGIEQLLHQSLEPTLSVLSGAAVRDDEWIKTLDDWLEIYEHHEGELLRKRQKLQVAQKNKKDYRQYRDNMAYRMGLKKKEN